MHYSEIWVKLGRSQLVGARTTSEFIAKTAAIFIRLEKERKIGMGKRLKKKKNQEK